MTAIDPNALEEAAARREAPVVTSDYYTSIPLLDKHAMTRQAFGY